MKTETEKAIQSVEDTYNIHENHRSSSDEETERIFRQRDDVIFLLQQGEKYEKMFNEVEMKFKTLHTDYETGEEYYSGVINATHIKEIKQRYFPEELPDEKTTKL